MYARVGAGGPELQACSSGSRVSRAHVFLQADCPDFHTEKVICAAPGSWRGGHEVSVEVCFEPSHWASKGIPDPVVARGRRVHHPPLRGGPGPQAARPLPDPSRLQHRHPLQNVFSAPCLLLPRGEQRVLHPRRGLCGKKINNITVYLKETHRAARHTSPSKPQL